MAASRWLSRTFARERAYWGEISGGAADEQLFGKPKGTYLYRYSPRSASAVISFVAKDDGEITHALVVFTDDGLIS
eukprot:CAMPEP_0198314788 /NCGR_PEP_ID=MMETSP1450-20131203/5302_1 /TAXON_ID=753684 ORGANISM="Madagascaria erythrocladiodes, Strain CCMP3234" /NCGR_SAMPLE_ID=MMETSP1450 /ASSEMBLY_ACC=CAM_ASM_001115 /LENGTH=75 /DNA_ID=CAMNT_0044017869 /DNA_START=5 /DNA_END=229 /DNA_ORIENTATION=+